MTTIIDVLDSAVKIGLGAAISGLATYVTVSSKSKQDVQLEILRRDREILEEAAEHTEQFTNSVLRRWAVMVDLTRICEKDREPSEELQEKAQNALNDVSEAAQYLTSAEAKLLLLGYERSQKLLRDYGETSIRFVRKNWHKMPDVESSHLELKKSEILDMRRALFVSLSTDYRMPSTQKSQLSKAKNRRKYI